MAEVPGSESKMALWPSLRKKLGDAKKKTTGKKQKSNPFASQGLEKFSLLMAELQAKKSSLVDKTGNSVSAVRYLSRSAQEWTAETIARTASRRRAGKDAPPPQPHPEVLLSQQSLDPRSKETTAQAEIVDFSQSFSFPDPDPDSGHGHNRNHSYGFDSPASAVGDLERESSSALSETATEELGGREPLAHAPDEVGCSGSDTTLPATAKSARLIRTGRLLLLERGWARSPNSAVSLLVALSACVVARVTKIGSVFFELLTVDLVLRLQRGKLYADFLQSLVTRHIAPHLSIRVPRGLALLPLVRRKRPSAELHDAIPRHTQQSEISPESDRGPDPSFRFPVVPEPSRSYPALVVPHRTLEDPTPASSPDIRSSSPTRRLVRRLSKLKSKMSKSPTPGSPTSSDASHHSASSSPRSRSKFSFSRRHKEKEAASSDDGWPDDEVFADTASSSSSSSKRRCILSKKCSLRKEKTPAREQSTTTLRRSPLGRNFSSQTRDMTPLHELAPDSRHPASVFDAGRKNFDLWLTMGLLVALVFLLVSRLSAIVATSLLFVLLSHALKVRSKHGSPPRRDNFHRV